MSETSREPAPIGIIITSHNKPDLLRETINSVLGQTFTNWKGIIWDSGVLHSQGYFDNLTDPRFDVLTTGEEPGANEKRNMASWCYNQTFARGLIDTKLITYCSDDDIIYPHCFEVFVACYEKHPEINAMYGAEDVMMLKPDGTWMRIDERLANDVRGKRWGGTDLAHHVDYLQFCHTLRMVEKFSKTYETNEIHSEDTAHRKHADGLFMEQMAALTPVIPVPIKIGANRRTPDSVNLEFPTDAVALEDRDIQIEDVNPRDGLFICTGWARTPALIKEVVAGLAQKPNYEEVELVSTQAITRCGREVLGFEIHFRELPAVPAEDGETGPEYTT